MNKNYKLFMIILISYFNLSPYFDPYGFDMLDDKDYAFEENQDQPALQSPPGMEPQWKSFNEWRCFPTYLIRHIHCYDRSGTYFLMLTLLHEDQTFLFDTASYLQDLSHCLAERDEWIRLMANQESACFFAAQMPTLEEKKHPDIALWTVYGIKTLAGRIMAPIYEDEKDSEN